jgi:hypothetical protein
MLRQIIAGFLIDVVILAVAAAISGRTTEQPVQENQAVCDIFFPF